MRLFPTICIFMLFPVCAVYAQITDDNIIIDNKTETYIYTDHAGSLILTERSKAEYRCLKWPETISVVQFYDNYSEIKNATGKVAKKVSPTYQMYQQEGIFYSDTRVCYFNLPFTKKEETATVAFEKIYNDISLFTRIFLFEPQYVKRKTVEITIPSWMSVDIIDRNLGGNIGKSEATDPKSGAITYTYTVNDQEAVKWEKGAPGYYKTSPYLIVIPRKASRKSGDTSFFNDYNDVYRWCKNRANLTFNDREAIESFTRRIIAGCETEEDKVAEIFAWVQNNIRYLAFAYGLAGWVPDSAQDVLQKKYGDCKGMSNLLKTMLCSAGFDARLVWIGTNRMYSDPTIPLPLFNHMICALFRNGKVTYLDPTVKYMVVGEYHEAIQGRPSMIEDGEGHILGHVPCVPVSQNTDSLYCTYRIDGNMLVGDVSMTLSGESKQAVLSQIYALESSRRTNELKQFLEKGRPQDKVSDIDIEGVDSRENILHIKYREIRNGSVNRIGEEIYVDMDTRQDYGLSVIDTLIRKTDIEFPFRELTLREEYLEIPEGYQVTSLPEALHIENDNCRFDVTYRMVDGKVHYRKEIEVKETWLKKQDFQNWNDDIVRLKRSYQQQLILKKTEI